MNVDSYYYIGKDHNICQDYAFTALPIFPYLSVADGCSSSQYVDVGARILAHATYEYLSGNLFELGDNAIQQIINRSKEITDNLFIPVSALDATVVCAYVKNDNTVILIMFGDGTVFWKTKKGKLHCQTGTYSNNAPYYMSYSLDKKREQEYLQEYGGIFILDEFSIEQINKLYTVQIRLDQLEMFGVATDGVSSFYDFENNQLLQPIDVIREFTNFKNVNGEFLKRRMIKTKKDFEKRRIINSDDVALAVCLVGE